MMAIIEAIDVGNDEHYSDDSFQDDFESDTASTSHRELHVTENTGLGARPAAEGHAEARESTPMSALGQTPTHNFSSGTRQSPRSSPTSSALHSSVKSPAHVTSAANRVPSTASSTSSSMSPSPKSSSRSTSDDSTNESTASEQGMRSADQPTHEDDSTAMLADRVYDRRERPADGCVSEPRSHRSHFSADKRSTGDAYADHASYPGDSPCEYTSADVSLAEHCRVQRPDVPQTAEEILKMQEENARLREEYFQRSREQYHASFSQTSKAGSTFNGNRTIGGPVSSLKSAMTSTVGGAFRRHREAAARLVQESLMEHRTLQVLQLEQRDLLQRRSELKKLVRDYKKASKYKDYIEIAKQDIAILTEDYHDARLEVRCNEKLLVMNEAMSETGLGDRRLLEEVRSESALTQRRREHALRDADNAQRVRDAAAQRLEELKWELEKRRKWALGANNAEGYQLRVVNQAKKERIRELRGQLQQLRQACVELGGVADPHSKQSRLLTRKYQHPHYRNQRDDAEREYLKERIAEMRRELETMESRRAHVVASQRGSIGDEPSLASNARFAAPSPYLDAFGKGHPMAAQHAGALTATVVHDSARTQPVASVMAQSEPKNASEEIDVDAWLHAHSVSESAGNEAVYSPHNSRASDTAGSRNQDESVASAVYQAEGWHQAHTCAIEAAEAAQNEPPAWLDTGDDGVGFAVAPLNADLMLLSSSSYDAASGVEEDVAEEEEASGTDDEQLATAAAGQAHGVTKQNVVLFGPGDSASVSPAAASSNNDGPDWLNF
ncbi:hypothetical protein GH5_03164 [Leishmania sp. Ghana 2012 LV757]|uniref:hypothetical protein n=1 Tax=Leishmania sp. Ghana 2012 LV757 TaxID=2803181 RepID=UPI001B647170|nr:hypothetical protein GH5_03164 [Leishmania sp. Ghana 2012 LV757]